MFDAKIEALAYSEQNRILEIVYKNGQVWQLFGVPPSIYEELRDTTEACSVEMHLGTAGLSDWEARSANAHALRTGSSDIIAATHQQGRSAREPWLGILDLKFPPSVRLCLPLFS